MLLQLRKVPSSYGRCFCTHGRFQRVWDPAQLLSDKQGTLSFVLSIALIRPFLRRQN